MKPRTGFSCTHCFHSAVSYSLTRGLAPFTDRKRIRPMWDSTLVNQRIHSTAASGARASLAMETKLVQVEEATPVPRGPLGTGMNQNLKSGGALSSPMEEES